MNITRESLIERGLSSGRRFSTLQIGYIVASATSPITGTERYFFDLVRALPKIDIPTAGIVLGNLPAAERQTSGVESFAPETGFGFRKRVEGLRAAVRRTAFRADLIATHSSEHAWPILDLVRGKPLVVHFHGPRALEYEAEGRSAFRVAVARAGEMLTYRRAACFIALSQANADVLRDRYHIAESRIRVVPGAVDLERFHPRGAKRDARAALGWPLDRPIVVAARRLAVTKGLDVLVDAVARLRTRIPAIFVALVGAGPLRAELEARVAALGLNEHVAFTGQLDDQLPNAYRAADVSVVPSIALDGFGLSVVESLACGTAALVTPVTGLPEVVRDLDRTLIMPGTSAADIATALARALEDPASLPDAAACVAYAQRFAWPVIAARIAGVYADVLDERRRSR